MAYEARAGRVLGAASIDQKVATYGQRFDGLLEGSNATERVWLQMKTGGRMRSMLNEDWKSYFGGQASAAKKSGGQYAVVSQELPDGMRAYFQKKNIGFFQVK